MRESHDDSTVGRCVPAHLMEDVLLESSAAPLVIALYGSVVGVVVVWRAYKEDTRTNFEMPRNVKG